MVNRTKSRRHRRRHQRGGAWYDPTSWFGGDEQVVEPVSSTGSGSGFTDFFTNLGTKAKEGLQSANAKIGELGTSAVDSVKNASSSALQSVENGVAEAKASVSAPPAQPMQPDQMQQVSVGGHRRRHHSLKGGKGLGLTYYATPVSGLAVAEPKTWITGGTRRKHRRTKRGRSRKQRKTRRHIKH